jgi:predicted transcriptional regulator
MRKVLLSIKPHFAEAILNGTKDVEFRRAIWRDRSLEELCIADISINPRLDSQQIEGIVMYASSPVQMIVGEFWIDEIHESYNRFSDRSLDEFKIGCSREYLDSYLKGSKWAYAIELYSPRRYPRPHALSELGISRPPQNFQYLTPKQLNTVEKWT